MNHTIISSVEELILISAMFIAVNYLGRHVRVKKTIAILVSVAGFVAMIALDILSDTTIIPHLDMLESILIGLIIGSSSLVTKHNVPGQNGD